MSQHFANEGEPMSYAMEDMKADPIGMASAEAPASRAQIGQPMSYRIPRAGARPLRFTGSELAMAMSFTPEIPYWYEVNLYRTTESHFVVAIRLFHQAEDKRDTVEAWQFKTLDEAMAAIEHYDAAHDVDLAVSVPWDEISGAETAARALELQARIHGQRQHYRGLVGEILFELDAA